MDRCGTAAIARQARKSARRDVCTSGKRFDAAFRVAPGGPPTASKALTVAQATLLGLLLVDREPPEAMTRLSMVRNPGQPGVLPGPRHDLQTEATSYHRCLAEGVDLPIYRLANAGARPECPGRSGAVTGHTAFGHAPAPGIMAAV